MRPLAQSNGHDAPGLIDQLVPSVAAAPSLRFREDHSDQDQQKYLRTATAWPQDYQPDTERSAVLGLRRYPGYEHERSVLCEFSDVLSEEERAQLEAEWRREFERSWRPNFCYCKEGRIFTGDIARELHWLWADIPPPYLDKLMAERERRGRVCEVQEESQQGEAVTETSSPHERRAG